MFDRRKYCGLMSRLARKWQVETGWTEEQMNDSPAFGFVVATVAAANYPKGAAIFARENMRNSPDSADLGDDAVSLVSNCLPPIISHAQVRRVTEVFLQGGIDSYDALFQLIWGLTVRECMLKESTKVADSDKEGEE
jgi:hypothetical protein